MYAMTHRPGAITDEDMVSLVYYSTFITSVIGIFSFSTQTALEAPRPTHRVYAPHGPKHGGM